MTPVWAKIRTLLTGTEAMRSAGERYLPRHENERSDRYRDRLAANVLYNVAELTLDSWAGRPFSEPIVFGEDVPEQITDLLEDVDLQGNAAPVFARNWFREGLFGAFAHVLVDFPTVEDRELRSAADDRDESLRPYWSLIRPERLIFASSETVGSQEVLTHVRITETEIKREVFSEAEVNRIRIFDRVLGSSRDPRLFELEPGVYWSLWELQTKKWVQVQTPTPMEIDEIPIVTFYVDRQALLFGKSPMEDLVDLNVRHWQSNSDQINTLTVARFPIFAASGFTESEGDLEIGPKKLVSMRSTEGKFYYVEHSGAAIESGRKELQDLEHQMSNYGADFLRKRPGRETALARGLDAVEVTSPLQDAVRRFEDAIEQALVLTAKWLTLKDGGSVTINTDFGPDRVDPADVNTLNSARKGGDLSRETYLKELRRRGVLSDDFDEKENTRALDQELQKLPG